MALLANSTNVYSNTTFIVDANGSTPYVTVQSAINAAAASGLTEPTVFIRPGIYNEDLTLVASVNLEGQDRFLSVIDGSHTVPAAGAISIFNLGLIQSTPATNLFVEGGAGTCAINIDHCKFNINSGMAFNLPTSTGTISINNCLDISAQNSLIDNTTGASAIIIENSILGTGAVPAAFAGSTIIGNSTIGCPIGLEGAAVGNIDSCVVAPIGLTNTAGLLLDNSTIEGGINACISIGATATATLNNAVLNSSAVGGVVTGLGSCKIGEVTFPDQAGITVTTPVWTTLVTTGALQLDFADEGAMFEVAGAVNCSGAMLDGEILIGATGLNPAKATITGGAGVNVTNGPNTITLSSPGVFTWAAVAVDGSLVNDSGLYNTKGAGLLTMTLPALAAVNTLISLSGTAAGVGGWLIAQNAGQNIQFGVTSTTPGVGGSLASTDDNDVVHLLCVVANTTWQVIGSIGNITIV